MKLTLLQLIGLLEGPPRGRRVEILTGPSNADIDRGYELIIVGALKPRDLSAKQRQALGLDDVVRTGAPRRYVGGVGPHSFPPESALADPLRALKAHVKHATRKGEA